MKIGNFLEKIDPQYTFYKQNHASEHLKKDLDLRNKCYTSVTSSQVFTDKITSVERQCRMLKWCALASLGALGAGIACNICAGDSLFDAVFSRNMCNVVGGAGCLVLPLLVDIRKAELEDNLNLAVDHICAQHHSGHNILPLDKKQPAQGMQKGSNFSGDDWNCANSMTSSSQGILYRGDYSCIYSHFYHPFAWPQSRIANAILSFFKYNRTPESVRYKRYVALGLVSYQDKHQPDYNQKKSAIQNKVAQYFGKNSLDEL